jgi:hypothetical protein
MTKVLDIQTRIRQIDHQIQVLNGERAALTKERGASDLIKYALPGEKLTRKNITKLATLARIVDYLRFGPSRTTAEISSHLANVTGSSMKAATLRSHLHRFKLHKQLIYNQENEKWSLPN